MGNPLCPEKGCKQIMVTKEFTRCTGISEKTGKKTYGLSKYYVCPVHKHQRFKVGAEVILKKSIPIPEKPLEITASDSKKPKGRQMRYIIPRRIRRQILKRQAKNEMAKKEEPKK